MDQIEKLSAQAAQLHGDIKALEAAVEAENRPMTEEELAKQAKLAADFDRITNEIEQRMHTQASAEKLAKVQPRLVQAAPTASVTQAPKAGATTFSGGTPVAHNFANHGFTKGMGEYLLKVREAATINRADPRLMVNAISTFGGEDVGSTGGYALPPAFAQAISELVIPESSFLTALRPVQTSSNLLVVPTDEDAPWSSSGIVPAKYAEGAAITASAPVLRRVNVVLHTYAALVHCSEQSLSDIPFLSSYLTRKMGTKLNFMVENAIMKGDGQNAPLGLINAPGILTLSDIASTASVIAAIDVFNMKASLLPGSGAFWVVSPTVLPYLWSLKTDATAGYPLLVPSMRGDPGEGSLLGLPVYKSETAAAYNTTGDIMLVQPDGYVFAQNGGVNTAQTYAFAFDQQLQSYRCSTRIGGAPLLSNKVTRANGSTYASHVVVLQSTRS